MASKGWSNERRRVRVPYKKVMRHYLLSVLWLLASAAIVQAQIHTDSISSPAYLQCSPTSYAAKSGTTNVLVTITRNNNTSEPTSVSFSTSDNTAVAGTDYSTTSGTVTFNPGETIKTVSIPILQHASLDKTFRVDLFSPTYSGLITYGTAWVNILSTPKLQISGSAGTLQLVWPSSATNYVLETSAKCLGGTWTTMSDSVTTTNGQNIVKHACDCPFQFFRLRQL